MMPPRSDTAQPLRVCYVVSLFPCWSETFIAREIRALVSRGVEIRILSLKHPYEILVQPEAARLQHRVLYPPGPLRTSVTAMREMMSAPGLHVGLLVRILRRMWRTPLTLTKTLVTWWRVLGAMPRIRQDGHHLVHAHWATYPSTAAWIISETLEIPFSFTSHAHDIFVQDHFLNEKLQRAILAVTISEFNRKKLQRRLGEGAAQKVHVIHCGVYPRDLAYQPGGRENRSSILSVARLEEIKGLQYLVAACRIVRDRGLSFRCDIVGEGRLRRELELEIARARLGNVVFLPGAKTQPEVRALLYQASVFALPSIVTDRGDSDGIPVVLMEAMAAGTPVVSTTVSGIPELVEDRVSGLLVGPRDAETLATAIEQLLLRADLRFRLAARARETVERHFSVELETARLLELFNTSLKSISLP